MQQDIVGQPIPGVIGGMTDLQVRRTYVDRNFISSEEEKLFNGTTSPEQGRDWNPVFTSLETTLNPDTPANSAAQSIPWGVILAAAVVVYFMVRR